MLFRSVIQATEAIKLIIGAGHSLVGRLMLFDALKMSFRTLKLQRDPSCPVCGDHPTVTKLIDYEQFCGILPPPSSSASDDETEIEVEELKAKIDRHEKFFLLDVRERNEYEISRIDGATLIPLGELPRRLDEIPVDAGEIVVMCKMGGRSAKAADFLRTKGYAHVKNLSGGVLAWSSRVDPSQPRY